MNKSNSTNKNLFKIHQELSGMANSIQSMWHKQQINHFKKHNGQNVDTLMNAIHKLQTDHFVIENNDIKREGNDPVMQEGKTLEMFTQQYEELLNQPVVIVFP